MTVSNSDLFQFIIHYQPVTGGHEVRATDSIVKSTSEIYTESRLISVILFAGKKPTKHKRGAVKASACE
jgi:hypothetical protein